MNGYVCATRDVEGRVPPAIESASLNLILSHLSGFGIGIDSVASEKAVSYEQKLNYGRIESKEVSVPLDVSIPLETIDSVCLRDGCGLEMSIYNLPPENQRFLSGGVACEIGCCSADGHSDCEKLYSAVKAIKYAFEKTYSDSKVKSEIDG